MKKSNLIIIFALLIVIAAFILFGFQSLTHNPVQQINNNLPQAKITINQKTFDVWLAKTDAEHEHGLSGWQKLQDNQGMLFIFNKSSLSAIIKSQKSLNISPRRDLSSGRQHISQHNLLTKYLKSTPAQPIV